MQCVLCRDQTSLRCITRAILKRNLEIVASLHKCSVLYNTTLPNYTTHMKCFSVYLVKWVYSI